MMMMMKSFTVRLLVLVMICALSSLSYGYMRSSSCFITKSLKKNNKSISYSNENNKRINKTKLYSGQNYHHHYYYYYYHYHV